MGNRRIYWIDDCCKKLRLVGMEKKMVKVIQKMVVVRLDVVEVDELMSYS